MILYPTYPQAYGQGFYANKQDDLAYPLIPGPYYYYYYV